MPMDASHPGVFPPPPSYMHNTPAICSHPQYNHPDTRDHATNNTESIFHSLRNFQIRLLLRGGGYQKIVLPVLKICKSPTLSDLRMSLMKTELMQIDYDAFLQKWAKIFYLVAALEQGQARNPNHELAMIRLESDSELQELIDMEVEHQKKMHPGDESKLVLCVEQTRNRRFSRKADEEKQQQKIHQRRMKDESDLLPIDMGFDLRRAARAGVAPENKEPPRRNLSSQSLFTSESKLLLQKAISIERPSSPAPASAWSLSSSSSFDQSAFKDGDDDEQQIMTPVTYDSKSSIEPTAQQQPYSNYRTFVSADQPSIATSSGRGFVSSNSRHLVSGVSHKKPNRHPISASQHYPCSSVNSTMSVHAAPFHPQPQPEFVTDTSVNDIGIAVNPGYAHYSNMQYFPPYYYSNFVKSNYPSSGYYYPQ